jgi:hypothetical protein
MQEQPSYPPLPNYTMPYAVQPMMPSMQQPMQMQQPLQQPYSMEYPQWNPYEVITAFPPSNMAFPMAQSPSSFYGYMSPCYPISPPVQTGYLHGMPAPYSPWPEQMSPSFQDIDKRVEDLSSKEQEQDAPKESTIEVSSKKIKVPRKSSKSTSQALDDRVILHNFLQQRSSNSDSFRESKSNEPWMNR